MSGLTKFGIGLIILFVLSLVALLAEVCYVLWRRRRFRGHASAGEGELSGDANTSPSKELLYFFCWKNQSRIEPAVAPSFRSLELPGGTEPPDLEDLVKWQELFGPSRVLFTIKEEEREDYESEKSSSETKTKTKMKSTSLEEYLVAEELTVTIDVSDRETPFSTPCASPPYYTPSPSPHREVQNSVGDPTELVENDEAFVLGFNGVQRMSSESGLSGENKRSSVCLEVPGEYI